MTKGLLFDTHILIWYMVGVKVSKESQKIIESAKEKGELHLSTISLWEVAMAASKNKIILDRPIDDWLDDSLTELSINLVDLSVPIAVESTSLPDAFHGDPADRIIVATARVKQLTLLTEDKKILDYSKKNHLHTIRLSG